MKLIALVELLKEKQEVLRVLEDCLEYHSGWMNYQEQLSIGNEQVEGAYKNLIGAK